jgi:formylglycine-generating enzyme required for sulfatase activity
MVMDETPWLDEPLTKDSANTPATYVSHKKATAFCERLSEKEDRVYRLPTEAEWEYACRGGTVTAFYFGNKPFKLDDYGWYFNNAYKAKEQYPHPWGLKKPNHWMLYDMHGNVCEWCSDKYDLYPTTLIKKVTTDPKGPEKGRLHVWRGGGFSSNAQDVRSATRHISGGSHFRPEYLAGFRVVCEMKEQNIKSGD